MIGSVTTRTSGLLFSFFLALYVLSSPGFIDNPDGEIMYLVTEAMVERGDVAIRPGLLRVRTTEDPDSPVYSQYGWGMSLAAVPLYLAGRELGRFVKGFPPGFGPRFAASLLPAVLGALTLVIFHRLALLYFGAPQAIGLTLILGLATFFWPYAKFFHSAVPAALGVVGAFHAAVRALRGGRLAPWAWVGAWCGWVFIARLADGASLICALGAGIAWASRRDPRRLAAIFLAMGIGFLPFLLLWGGYNYARFGMVTRSGYAHAAGYFAGSIPEGLYGFLLSSGKSVFLYAPPLLASVWAHRRFRGDRPDEWALAAIVPAAGILLYAATDPWSGGWCWGPRYLLPVVPIALLPAGYLLGERRACFGTLVVAGFVIALAGVLANDARFLGETAAGQRALDPSVSEADAVRPTFFDPRRSPVAGAIRNIRHAEFDALPPIRDLHDPAFKARFLAGLNAWPFYLCRMGKASLALPAAFALLGVIVLTGIGLGAALRTPPPPVSP